MCGLLKPECLLDIIDGVEKLPAEELEPVLYIRLAPHMSRMSFTALR